MKIALLRAIPLALVVALAAACGDDPSGPPRVAAVQVASTADSVVVGETLQLSASIKDRGGADLAGRAVEWSSDNPGVARVDATGAITAVSMGSATITAKSGGQTGSMTIRVVAVAVKKVELNVPDRPALIATQTLQLVATAFDAAGKPITGRPIIWSSDNTNLATISSTGLVTVLRPGQLAVSATIGGVAAVLHLEVYSMGVSVFPDTVSLLAGGSRRIEARAFNDKSIRIPLRGAVWETSDPAVARVDSTGIVTAVGSGRAVITAVLGQQRLPAQIYVASYPQPLRFTTVTAGHQHACGLTTQGEAYCWGVNTMNQLGTQQVVSRCEWMTSDTHGYGYRTVFRCSAIPVPVAGGLRFTSIDAGEEHTCALTAAGAAYCWGNPLAAELGNGGAAPASNGGPVPVSGGITFRSLTAGSAITCGVSTSNEAYCWGGGGRLGDGTTANSSVPVKVAGGLSFATVDNNYSHACGITTSGATYCWGRNRAGELGTGTGPTNSTVPQRVAGNVQFTSVSAGDARTCALDAAGRAYCWGEDAGELGTNGFHGPSLAPVPAPGNLTFTSLIVDGRACGLTADGSRYCWDYRPTPPGRATPDFPIRRYAAGFDAECFISVEGVTYCRGVRYWGQTGAGIFDSNTTEITRVAGQ